MAMVKPAMRDGRGQLIKPVRSADLLESMLIFRMISVILERLATGQYCRRNVL